MGARLHLVHARGIVSGLTLATRPIKECLAKFSALQQIRPSHFDARIQVRRPDPGCQYLRAHASGDSPL